METTRSAMERFTCAIGPVGAAGRVAGNAACFIAMSAPSAGAMPAKLGVATAPTVGVAVLGAVVALDCAAAAALRASLLALCAEIASHAPTTTTNGRRNPAKTAKTFHPKPAAS